MYKGNIDQTLRLKYESELQAYWVTLIRKIWDPETHELAILRDTQAFTKGDWEAMWAMEKKNGVTWLHTTGYADFEILHDPTLPYKAEDLVVEY